MRRQTIWKILLALLSLPASFVLALASWRVAANLSLESPGNVATRYIARYIGFGGNEWDIGAPLRVALDIDTLLWLLLLWSAYFLIGKLRGRNER